MRTWRPPLSAAGERAGELLEPTCTTPWRAARRLAFVPEAAEWAGHLVTMLLKVHATCLDGQDAVARLRVEQALGHGGGA
jgi:hypothetical protein